MIDLLDECARIFSDHGFDSSRISTPRNALVFESNTVLGFVFTYLSASALISHWQPDSTDMLIRNRPQLQLAQQKAWNVYTIFLTSESAPRAAWDHLSVIEEDLAGTRKIARAAVNDVFDIRRALLPLLPIQASPTLEAIDIPSEVRQRASGIPTRVVDAFLSSANLTTLLSILEEQP